MCAFAGAAWGEQKGKHAFKFIVDDEWRFAPDQPTVADIEGRVNNFIDVSDFVGYTGEENFEANRLKVCSCYCVARCISAVADWQEVRFLTHTHTQSTKVFIFFEAAVTGWPGEPWAGGEVVDQRMERGCSPLQKQRAGFEKNQSPQNKSESIGQSKNCKRREEGKVGKTS